MSSFTNISINQTKAVFEIVGRNVLNENINNINWSINTSNNYKINSTLPISLIPNQTIYIYSAYNYSSSGTYTATATISNGSLQDSKAISVTI